MDYCFSNSMQFTSISESEALLVNGGGWAEFGQAFVGILCVAATPLVSVVSGGALGLVTLGTGIYLIGSATK